MSTQVSLKKVQAQKKTENTVRNSSYATADEKNIEHFIWLLCACGSAHILAVYRYM